MPVRVETPISGLTIVQLAPNETIPPHYHGEGYVVVPFLSATLERVTHHKGREIASEPLVLEPLVPYYVDATEEEHAISVRNAGGGFSVFQKIAPEPPVRGPQPELTKIPVVIQSSGNLHAFTAEVALTVMEQAVGMMFRPALAPDRGMLFAWGYPRHVGMYMRNVLIHLDFLFIDANFRITNIKENAAPKDLTPIRSQGDVVFTLELPGGTVARLGIAVGDVVLP
jgi:uncharacterized membrane protein (UPF0127 family)